MNLLGSALSRFGSNNGYNRNNGNSGGFMCFVKKYASQIQVFLVSIFLYFVYVKFLKEDKPTKPNGQINDANVIKEDDKDSTLSNQKASAIAEALYGAFNYWGGTDEDVIYNRLKGLTLADYNKVYNAFGLRMYSPYFGEGTVSILGGVEMTLTEWLINELDNDELKKLKALNPNLPL